MGQINLQKYKAFISYSSADKKTAVKLHKALEKARVPKDLIGLEGVFGPVPASLKPIFRDRDELSGGGTLDIKLKKALDQSAHLIVLCSPEAAKSDYVGLEIAYFKSLGRTERIIPLILSGSPDDPEQDCFPQALKFKVNETGKITMNREDLLAADARPSGDGWDNALLKVKAGMLGVGFDDLKRRDHHQQSLSIVQRKALLGLFIVIAMAAGYFIWHSQQKDQNLADLKTQLKDQKAQNAKIEATLTALMQHLKVSPAIAAQLPKQDKQKEKANLRQVVKAVAAEQTKQAEQALKLLAEGKTKQAETILAAVLARKQQEGTKAHKEAAKAARNLAQLKRYSDVKQAAAYYKQAAELDPKNARNWLDYGEHIAKTGDGKAAVAAFRQAIAAAKGGDNPVLNIKALYRLGDAVFAQGQRASAQRLYNTAKTLAEQALANHPNDTSLQRELSVSHEKIGDVLVAAGKRDDALKQFQTSLTIAERLAKSDPGNAGWQYDLGGSNERMGNVLNQAGDRAGALKHYQNRHDIISRLATSDPDNARWQRDLSVSHEKIGNVLVAAGKREDALKQFQASLAIAERLAKSDPGNAQWQRDLSVSHEKIGNVLVAAGKREDALKHYRADLAIAERLAKSDPGNAQWQRDLSVSHNKIGNVLVAAGKYDNALKQFQASLAIRERLAKSDPGNAGWQRDLAISHERMGDMYKTEGNLEKSLQAYQASLKIMQPRAQSDPGNTDWQRFISVSHEKIGDVLVATGKREDALKQFQASLAIREHLAKSDPGNAGWQRDLWVSHWRMASQGIEPLHHWQRVVELITAMKEKNILSPNDEQYLPIAKENLARAKNE